MSSSRIKSVVIGGGIIGLSTAYFLAKNGAEVVLLEKNKLGQGCSFANAGWLTPCFAMPLPMPGMLLRSFKWLANPNSPLYIKPSLNPDLVAWLFKFLKSMNQKQALSAIEAMIQLSQRSLQLYQELDRNFPNRIGFSRKGLLMVAKSHQGLQDIYEELQLGSKFGIEGKTLNSNDCVDLEPSLKPDLLGGVHFINEAHAEPYSTIELLAELCRQQGVQILEGSEFLNWQVSLDRVQSIEYSLLGKISHEKVDALILCTGSWSKSLSKKLGLYLPIFGGKGYSMNVLKMPQNPSIPIMYLEKKIAITPRLHGTRIAGTLELVDEDFSITQRRVNNIRKGVSEILHITSENPIENLWAGLRPCTPDGVPMIGSHKLAKNLFIGVGHQMLGFQTGIGSGELLSRLVTGGSLSKTEQVYAPNRF